MKAAAPRRRGADASRRGLVAAVVTLALAGCSHTPPTPDAREVDDFTIEGTRALEESAIKEKLLTDESSWLPWWFPIWGHTAWFDESAWQADLRRITRVYEAHGYYQARILDEQVNPNGPGHVKLLVKVFEGEPARIVSVDFSGLERLPAEHQQAATAKLPVREGLIFLEEDWGDAKALLASRLRELGYAEAVVTGEALVDARAAKVNLSLDVSSGPRYRFGQIFVATDPGAQVPPKLISEVAGPEVKPGDWYSESALADAQARVFQMGVFAGVKVTRGAPNREAETVPTVIDVKEAPFRSIRLGGGASIDMIRNEVRFIGEYTDRNLGLAKLFNKNYLLDKLSLKGKLGYAFLPNVIQVAAGDPAAKHGVVGRLLTEYTVPRAFGVRTLDFFSSLDVQRNLDVTYDYAGGDVKLGFVWRPILNLTLLTTANLSLYFLTTKVSVRDNVKPEVLGCPLYPQACVTTFLDVLLEWDRRDDKLEPHDGYYAALTTSGGLARTDVVRPFLRIVPEVRGYVSFGEARRLTLAGKVRFGFFVGEDPNTPALLRFFSGGSYMRGFNQRRLSPMVAVPVADPDHPGQDLYDVTTAQGGRQVGPETLPVGGNSLIEASFEVRWNVWGNLVLSVFNDWGLVTSKPLLRGVDFGQYLYTAVGLGVRYRTPIGPIRLDVGYRLPLGGPQEVDTSSGVKTFRNDPGCLFWPNSEYHPTPMDYAGAPDGRCAFHLSIGEAF
ncbi:MAG: BamA/TamA family outer membrane protein [Myxococcota bacterium]